MGKKQKPNERCACGSGIKYKKCCWRSDEAKRQEEFAAKQQVTDQFRDGHPVSSDIVQKTVDYLQASGIEKVFDVSNILTGDTYRPIQEANYFRNVAMVAERNAGNESVFESRGPYDKDLMVLCKGAYQCYNSQTEFRPAMNTVLDMIETRFAGKDYKL